MYSDRFLSYLGSPYIYTYEYQAVSLYLSKSAPVYQCTSVVFLYTSVPVHQRTGILVYQYTSVLVWQCTSVPVH